MFTLHWTLPMAEDEAPILLSTQRSIRGFSTGRLNYSFKRISDVYDEEFRVALEESDGDKEYAVLPEFHRFEIPESCHWNPLDETIKLKDKRFQSSR